VQQCKRGQLGLTARDLGVPISITLCPQLHSYTQDTHGPALVSCQLGCLHYQRGELQQAVTCFERFFELARSLDQRLLDTARINLGVTRGALRLQQYMAVAATDLPRLLELKQTLRGPALGG